MSDSESKSKKQKSENDAEAEVGVRRTSSRVKRSSSKVDGSESKMVLGYWKIRGLAQPIRLLLEFTKQPYENKCYEQGDKESGYSREEWLKEKNTLGLAFPNLPYLIDGDFKITQSNAILRYIAEKHKLAGHTTEEKIRLEELAGVAGDIRGPISKAVYSSESDFPQHLEDLQKKLGEEYLPLLEAHLKDHTFFGGKKVTYVDFIFYETFDQLSLMCPKVLEPFPHILAFHKRIEELPAIAEYLRSDRFSKHPVNNKSAAWK